MIVLEVEVILTICTAVGTRTRKTGLTSMERWGRGERVEKGGGGERQREGGRKEEMERKIEVYYYWFITTNSQIKVTKCAKLK